MFLSACIAGLEIGFSYLLICTLYGSVDEQVIFKLFGLAYPLGFVLVIMGKSALFTEQTLVLALPVLNRQRSFLEMLNVWGWVILGYGLGGAIVEVYLNIGFFESNKK
ncbi:MAG: formate/nitrite transporter family protein [Mesonia sp.]|uniref:formate/nitrite transporter family protein n=1 Tax=Mesonia sp. TaxID=1960830 RepID=UPI003F9CC1BA